MTSTPMPGITRPLRIAVVYPDLLGTYGDGGNGLILARRADWRGFSVELLQAASDAALPEADLYCLGGGEDGPQVRAARTLTDDGTLARRVADGAVVLAVCAGYQIVGRSFPGADDAVHEGVGLLDISTIKGDGPRAVGEVVAEPIAATLSPHVLPTLTGFENHGGRTTLGAGALPLAQVTHGIGNGNAEAHADDDADAVAEPGGDGPIRTEGARSGRVVGTYLHGPVLARNPELADLLLAWALDIDTLETLDDSTENALRDERLASTTTRSRRFGRRSGSVSGRRSRSRP